MARPCQSCAAGRCTTSPFPGPGGPVKAPWAHRRPALPGLILTCKRRSRQSQDAYFHTAGWPLRTRPVSSTSGAHVDAGVRRYFAKATWRGAACTSRSDFCGFSRPHCHSVAATLRVLEAEDSNQALVVTFLLPCFTSTRISLEKAEDGNRSRRTQAASHKLWCSKLLAGPCLPATHETHSTHTCHRAISPRLQYKLLIVTSRLWA